MAAEPAPKVVDFSADVMRPVKIADSSALSLVGHVVFYHNGAVITCDSAIRFNDRMMDCYNNVIINKDSTFIYGDRAEYNGNFNTARVFSPLVKISAIIPAAGPRCKRRTGWNRETGIIMPITAN